MGEQMKDWIINVGIQKGGPSLIRAALAGLIGILLAHSNQLAALGIVYDKPTDTILWHLTTAREWMGTIGLGLVASMFMVGQHHIEEAIKPAAKPPQGGN
jgi:hypothetical protein